MNLDELVISTTIISRTRAGGWNSWSRVQGRREHGPQAPVLVLPVHLPEVVSLQPQPGDVARPVPDAARPVHLHTVVLRGGNIIQLST